MRIEQTELRDAGRQLLGDLGPGTNTGEALAAIRDAGWLALTASEAQGGLEQPFEAAAWLYLEIGHAISPAPLLPGLMAADAINAAQGYAGADEWIGRIAAGEPPAASLLCPTEAALNHADGMLSGALAMVQGAGSASHVLVAAPGIAALVPLDRDGVTVTPHTMWDATRELAEVSFDGVAIEAGDILAEGKAADVVIAAATTHLHFAIAGDCVGSATALLDQTVEYLKTRKQFDRPLAMFQALKHRCADLKAYIVAAEAMYFDGLAQYEDGTADPVTLARGVKALCSATFRDVAEESMQLHGGIGMTSEYPCHLYFKRALLNEHLASGNDACEVAVGQALQKEMAA
ncbi:acyl-CoA dehydrogenase family protein [Stakelama tenebrarum]|uniref:Acyl-CoA/acyl-ACP dehydrogenase n=1 Tax=Stakelama tenebrarum TaxID=2711215 RepID=A0A6G6Y744_9SPHN|nr:acyl-CoA dehydrogenase family protein [Sphingosinithalassobacter tenebrarum]QIG80762.1 acyl-CoA/acyl-ACP dehydrogenase [Sphingosinithalassobacter tenebrarum]